MAEGHVAAGTRDAARERIRLIAEELGRRSRTENLKAEASALRGRVTAQVKRKASETTDALKARATEAARSRAQTFKEQVMAKPIGLAVAGGIAGALVGAFLGRRREAAQHYVKADTLSTGTVQPPNWETRETITESFGEPVAGAEVGARPEALDVEEEHGAKARASAAVEHGRERLSDAVEKARGRARGLQQRAGDRMGAASERLRSHVPSASEARDRARGYVHDEPAMLAVVALAAGACLGLLLPLTGTERRALRGAHQRAKEGIQSGFDKAQEALDERRSDAPMAESRPGMEANEDVERERHGGELEPPAIH